MKLETSSLPPPPPGTDRDLAHALVLLCRAVEVGWIQDKADLGELIGHLAEGRDWGVQEAMYEIMDGKLCVSFLDDEVHCDLAAFLAYLRQWHVGI